MIKGNDDSKAQSWELEVICKNKKYLDAVVKAILKIGKINFEVENIECITNHPKWDSSYSVLMWCSWFSNLNLIAKKLDKIEKKFENND